VRDRSAITGGEEGSAQLRTPGSRRTGDSVHTVELDRPRTADAAIDLTLAVSDGLRVFEAEDSVTCRGQSSQISVGIHAHRRMVSDH
jgi:hypothetical protein